MLCYSTQVICFCSLSAFFLCLSLARISLFVHIILTAFLPDFSSLGCIASELGGGDRWVLTRFLFYHSPLLLMRMRSNIIHLLDDSIVWRRKVLSIQTRKPPGLFMPDCYVVPLTGWHEVQGLWTWSCFYMPVEGHICLFFLAMWPVDLCHNFH